MCDSLIPRCIVCNKQPVTANANIYKLFQKSSNRIHSEELKVNPYFIAICDDCLERWKEMNKCIQQESTVDVNIY